MRNAKAEARPRWGYRRLALLLRRESWVVNLKRVLRVYRADRLRVRKGRRRKQVSTIRVPPPLVDGPNTQWTVDFIHDQLAHGRRFRTLSIDDECARECLALAVEASWPGAQVAAVLDDARRARGAPQRIILNHGPELAGRALDARAYGRDVELAFTRPGTPVDNCFVESFHEKFRGECLTTHGSLTWTTLGASLRPGARTTTSCARTGRSATARRPSTHARCTAAPSSSQLTPSL